MSNNTRVCIAGENLVTTVTNGDNPLSALLSHHSNPAAVQPPEPEQTTPEPANQPTEAEDPVPFDCQADNRICDDILFVCHMHKDAKPSILCGPGKDWKIPEVPRLLLRLYNTEGERAAIQFIENGWQFYMDCMDPQSAIFPREDDPPKPPPGEPATVIDPHTTSVDEFRRLAQRVFEENK